MSCKLLGDLSKLQRGLGGLCANDQAEQCEMQIFSNANKDNDV